MNISDRSDQQCSEYEYTQKIQVLTLSRFSFSSWFLFHYLIRSLSIISSSCGRYVIVSKWYQSLDNKYYAGFAALDSSLRYHPSSSENTLFNSPTGNKTSWRCRNDVSLYVPATSHVSLKWNTQRRLTGTLPRRLSGTSSRRLIDMSWRRLMGT